MSQKRAEENEELLEKNESISELKKKVTMSRILEKGELTDADMCVFKKHMKYIDTTVMQRLQSLYNVAKTQLSAATFGTYSNNEKLCEFLGIKK